MRFTLVLVGFLVLSGCTPFVDARHEAGKVATLGQSQADRPAICYNPLWTKKSAIESMAQSECQKQKKRAVYDSTNYFSCCFFYPSTAFYKCQ